MSTTTEATEHGFTVGTILDTLWGYDQTNRDFYEVVKISGEYATVREIAAMDTHDAGSMTGKKLPIAGNYIGEPIRRKIKPNNSGGYIPIKSYLLTTIWNGKPANYSTYA